MINETRFYYKRIDIIDGFMIYKAVGMPNYVLHFYEDEKPIDLYFGFEYHSKEVYFPLLYKNGRNYKTYRYIVKYATMPKVQAIIDVLKGDLT